MSTLVTPVELDAVHTKIRSRLIALKHRKLLYSVHVHALYSKSMPICKHDYYTLRGSIVINTIHVHKY